MKIKSLITTNDIKNFMRLSGDYNYIHWNKSYCSRSIYGEPIVHGSLIILKLVKLLKLNKYKVVNSFNCLFSKPLYVNHFFYYNIIKIKEDYFIKITDHNQKSIGNINLIISFQNNINKIKIPNNLKVTKKKKPIKRNEKTLKKLIKKNVKIKFSFYKKYSLFENLVLNISRIIGMEIPGYYSLFHSLDVKFNNDSTFPILKINNYNNKFRFIQNRINYFNYTANFNSILLKEFINLDYFYKIKEIIKNKSINKNILIIGGSRGLGFITTQICSIMKANVTSTYLDNKLNLFNLKKNYKISNLKVKKLNVNDIKNFKFDKYKYIFYFASPKILNDNFSYMKYNKVLNNYYINSLKAIENKIKNCVKIFIPSTIFINNSSKKNIFKNYTQAKVDMEKHCNKINKLNSKVKYFVYRLKEFNTDQNYSIFDMKKNNDISYLTNIIGKFLIK